MAVSEPGRRPRDPEAQIIRVENDLVDAPLVAIELLLSNVSAGYSSP